jgi:alpha-L-fucosidase
VAKWRQMRFGMFIHWGPVSLKGTEIGWSRGAEVPIEEYDNLYKRFNPTKFDADQWVKVAKDAGVKYIVLTTKHHDGFCLWDTKQTDHNIMNSPFGRDVVKELAAACKKQGIAFGTYYSTCDWHHPDFPLGSPGGQSKKPHPNLDRYEQYLRKQVEELIRNYGPLCTLWFDVPQEFSVERGQGVVKWVRSLQPDIMINNRTGCPGDYDTPEQTVGRMQTDRPWETCMTICQQWAWKPNDQMKSLKECLHVLINTVGGDGNLVFNVGPMPDGQIEPRQVERLKEMGQWLSKYGESVYGTRGGPFTRADWGAATHKDDTIYLHILNPKLDTLKLPAIKQKIVGSSVLTGGTATVNQSADGIEVSVPKADRQEIDTIVVLKLDGPVAE